jgi:RecJ-like exonuclease
MPKRKCNFCDGKGGYGKNRMYVCDKCNGTGYIFTKPTPAQCRKVAEVIKNKDNPYEKYRNPDKRCHYPFQPIDYCWSYAGLVDKRATEKEIEQFCKGCEFWKALKRKGGK